MEVPSVLPLIIGIPIKPAHVIAANCCGVKKIPVWLTAMDSLSLSAVVLAGLSAPPLNHQLNNVEHSASKCNANHGHNSDENAQLNDLATSVIADVGTFIGCESCPGGT